MNQYAKRREVIEKPRTVVFERPTRVLIRFPSRDTASTLAYVEMNVGATGYSAGTVHIDVCTSKRCCGRPKK